MMLLKPSEIMFSQDSINNFFDMGSLHGDVLIGETLDDICEGLCSIDDIPTIRVVKLNGKWVTADNRRLWIFQQLERLGKCDKIRVYETYFIAPDKLNSVNGGVSVRVRRDPGGHWHRKPSVRRVSSGSTIGSNYMTSERNSAYRSRQSGNSTVRAPSSRTWSPRSDVIYPHFGRNARDSVPVNYNERERQQSHRARVLANYTVPEHETWCPCTIL